MIDNSSIEKRIQRLTAEELDIDVMDTICELKSLVSTLAQMLMIQSNQLASMQSQLNLYMYGSTQSPVDMAEAYPKENDYNGVREYVERRKANDKVFREYCIAHTRKDLCKRLSDIFGWVVDEKHYGRNLLRHMQ